MDRSVRIQLPLKKYRLATLGGAAGGFGLPAFITLSDRLTETTHACAKIASGNSP
jgi:hypothetical protein